MASAAEQVVRAVQSERVFQAVERSKHEHERFYRASAELNRALTLDEVYDAAIAGARGVCEFDFAAIATYDARRGSHTIRRVVGEAAEQPARHHAQGSVVDRLDGGQEQAGAAGGRRLARARRPGLLAPDAHQGLRVAAGAAAAREGRSDRHVHRRRPRAPAPSPATGARCWA